MAGGATPEVPFPLTGDQRAQAPLWRLSSLGLNRQKQSSTAIVRAA